MQILLIVYADLHHEKISANYISDVKHFTIFPFLFTPKKLFPCVFGCSICSFKFEVEVDGAEQLVRGGTGILLYVFELTSELLWNEDVSDSLFWLKFSNYRGRNTCQMDQLKNSMPITTSLL